MQPPCKSRFRCTRPSCRRRRPRIQLSSRPNNNWSRNVRMLRSPRSMSLSNCSSPSSIRSPYLRMRSASTRMILKSLKRIKRGQWPTLPSNSIARLNSWPPSIKPKSSRRSRRLILRPRKWNSWTTRSNNSPQRLALWRHNSRRRTPLVPRWRPRSRS